MPARLPDEVKRIRATARPGRARATPDAPPGSPPRPEHLSGLAADCWDALCRDLAALHLLFVTDAALIGVAASLLADSITLRGMIAKNGPTYEARTAAGAPMVRARPEAGLLDSTERRLLTALNALGLTPKSRTGLDTTRPTIPHAASKANGRGYF